MAYDTQAAQANLRATYYDKLVKQTAREKYRLKELCSISPTSAWNNVFFREDPTNLTDLTTNPIKGIPRGATFRQGTVTWEKVTTYIQKFGLEQNVPWEDIQTDEINVKERVAIRIGERVAKAVDDEIWNILSDAATFTVGISNLPNIQSYEVSFNAASGAAWNESSAAIMKDLGQALVKIADYNYSTDNCALACGEQVFASIMNYLYEKGAQSPSIATGIVEKGKRMSIAGVEIIKSHSIPASYALLAVKGTCATWKEMMPLSTEQKDDPFKSWMIRAAEVGVTELTDPKAIVLLYGTDRR